MTEHWDIIIIGAGASGLAAAAAIARSGTHPSVLLLEQADRPGKKLLATGNGRCNLYNTGLSAEHFVSRSPEALGACLQTVLRTDQPAFWRDLGLMTAELDEGRVYPASLQAAAVTDTLRAAALAGGAELRCGQRVTALRRCGGGFRVTAAGGAEHAAGRVILAAGGRAAPKLGATGDGYALAEGLGHSCVPTVPGLVPVRCVNPGRTLPGVRNAAEVTLSRGEQVLAVRRGEVQFTEYGVSGIVIMDLSSRMIPGEPHTLTLNFMPDRTAAELSAFLREKVRNHPAQRAEFLLLGVLKRQLGEVILRACRVDGKRRRLASLTEDELARIVQRIRGWTMRTEGTLSWEQAQVTRGGIPPDEVRPDTFESRMAPGLYLTGELLDAAGDCGGFNLAWAFGSGIAAGRAAARCADPHGGSGR